VSATPPRPAVFFDRDGTLNREIEGALSRPEQMELLPGAAEAVRAVREAGFAAIVLTNQSAIARGWMTHWELEQVQAALLGALAARGAPVDGWMHCPHLDTGGLAPYHRPGPCRKPEPGMLLEAARRWDLELESSWVIGDALRDLAAGAAVGARGILVLTGKGPREVEKLALLPRSAQPFAIASDPQDAVRQLLAAR
jgi:D-glycero-D-manno-heptose 1,7-bisphosphate phosphatase